MPIDQSKVDAFLQYLKNTTENQNWIELDGFYAITSLDINEDASGVHATFHPDSGAPLKAFVNTVTGEVRLCHYTNLKQ